MYKSLVDTMSVSIIVQLDMVWNFFNGFLYDPDLQHCLNKFMLYFIWNESKNSFVVSTLYSLQFMGIGKIKLEYFRF